MNYPNSMIKASAMSTEKQKNSQAIITLTKGGMELGLKLLELYPHAELYINTRFHVEDKRVFTIQNGIKELIKSIFTKYDCLIFIMATGIVVRSIAPLIKDKTLDPAVVVMDERGKNVISLLSGHMGRANEYTFDIATSIKSNPVITTASDVNKSIAVDSIAMELNCEIEGLKDATKITSHIVNGEKVGIISDINFDIALPDNVLKLNNSDLSDIKGLIYITNDNTIRNMKRIDSVILRPKNIIIGLGCRRGKTKDEIINSIKDAMDKVNKSLLSIKHIATVDIKSDELGIIEASSHLNVPMVIINKEDIKKVENRFETSQFVKNTIGVGAVAEPVGMISSRSGRIILNKTKYNGVTVSIVEEGGDGNGYCSSRLKP